MICEIEGKLPEYEMLAELILGLLGSVQCGADKNVVWWADHVQRHHLEENTAVPKHNPAGVPGPGGGLSVPRPRSTSHPRRYCENPGKLAHHLILLDPLLLLWTASMLAAY